MLEDLKEEENFPSDIYIPIPKDTHVPIYRRADFMIPIISGLLVLTAAVLLFLRLK